MGVAVVKFGDLGLGLVDAKRLSIRHTKAVEIDP
jgi:hypothetical protein